MAEYEAVPESEGRPTAQTEVKDESGQVPVLRMEGIGKTFGAVRALRGVGLEVYAGEVVALVGDNGAGKSTLVKTISGVGPADEGEIYVDGKQVTISSPQVASELGIETVYQDLALCDNLDVISNLYLGHELRTRYGTINEIEMERRGLAVLRTLDVKLPSARALVSALSGGQRQSIAVAKTILRNARLVMLDEPTAALGVAQTRQVLNLIRRLKTQGLAVLVISHNMVDVFEVADRVIVMRLGQRVGNFDVKNTTTERVIAAITGAEFGPTKEEVKTAASSEEQTDE
ncbi:MAG TPA: ATP-binding cassette domain-containing protein [Dictyobacter sp.]|jgi:D-xylose transport system ATP-binding protein|nr:ATP-binding cassette domain-containing protein [Dictyobacter sp.]